MTDGFPLGPIIKAELARCGASQADMARDLGYSQKHVSQVLTGRATASLATAVKMLKYVGLELQAVPRRDDP
jgi:plasmid maintenance system antidote protein VapI